MQMNSDEEVVLLMQSPKVAAMPLLVAWIPSQSTHIVVFFLRRGPLWTIWPYGLRLPIQIEVVLLLFSLCRLVTGRSLQSVIFLRRLLGWNSRWVGPRPIVGAGLPIHRFALIFVWGRCLRLGTGVILALERAPSDQPAEREEEEDDFDLDWKPEPIRPYRPTRVADEWKPEPIRSYRPKRTAPKKYDDISALTWDPGY